MYNPHINYETMTIEIVRTSAGTPMPVVTLHEFVLDAIRATGRPLTALEISTRIRNRNGMRFYKTDILAMCHEMANKGDITTEQTSNGIAFM